MRKQIHVEERKDEKFCDFSEIEDGKMTNKLQYYVRESERTLRVLHLMFVHANSPDRMSILLKASLYIQTLLTECDCCSKNQSRSGYVRSASNFLAGIFVHPNTTDKGSIGAQGVAYVLDSPRIVKLPSVLEISNTISIEGR